MPRKSKAAAAGDEPVAKRRSLRIKGTAQKPEPKPKQKAAPKAKKAKEEKPKVVEKEADVPAENGDTKTEEEAPATDAAEEKEDAAE